MSNLEECDSDNRPRDSTRGSLSCDYDSDLSVPKKRNSQSTYRDSTDSEYESEASRKDRTSDESCGSNVDEDKTRGDIGKRRGEKRRIERKGRDCADNEEEESEEEFEEDQRMKNKSGCEKAAGKRNKGKKSGNNVGKNANKKSGT